MSQRGLRAALGVILVLAGCSGCNDSWEGFKSQKWRFAAKFPGKVSEESHANFAEFQAVTEQATFRITSTKVSPLPAKEALAELVAMRDSSTASLHATLAESKTSMLKGSPPSNSLSDLRWREKRWFLIPAMSAAGTGSTSSL